MREGDSTDFSRLKTVSKFDRGESKTLAMDLTSQSLPMFSPPSLFVESLLDQLCKLFEKDPRRQRNLYLTICQQLHQMNLIDESYKLDEFQYMRSHYQKALYHFLSVAKSTLAESKAILSMPSKIKLSAENILEWSRYSTEFRELEFIAKGGFGYVYKSQHLLDGGIYAIKKLFMSYRSVNGFLQNLREVKMLAQLNHPNIVAYKAAWLEPMEERKKSVPAISEAKSDVSNGDSIEVVFEHSDKASSDQSDRGAGNDCSSLSQSSPSSRSSSSCGGRSKALCEYKKKPLPQPPLYRFTYKSESRSTGDGANNNRRRRRRDECATLFIQMQFCQTTLRQWLDQRNQSNDQIDLTQSIAVFKQIVRGVEYIHSRGIVHHDIKPSNIFVSEDLANVQVGDFGLSCCLLAHGSSSDSYIAHQLGQYGTKLYAAPEQLNNICHPKSDVYSLGIVLVELMKSFQTAMERSKILSQLKSGLIPEDISSSFPHLADIIRRTVSGNFNKRPTAHELLVLLEESENVNAEDIIRRQKSTIEELKEENLAIKRDNIAKDEIIAALTKQLNDFRTRFKQEIHDFT